jgi:Spy/CpxP family protein refolding chaperone
MTMRTPSALAVTATLLIATVFGAAGAGATLVDQGDGPLGGLNLERLQRLLPRIAELLELTPAQIFEIGAILADELPGIRDLADQLAAARRDYWSTHDLGAFDEDDYRAFLAANAPAEDDLRVASVRTMSRIWNVLSPDQQQRLLRLVRLLVDGNGPRRGVDRFSP